MVAFPQLFIDGVVLYKRGLTKAVIAYNIPGFTSTSLNLYDIHCFLKWVSNVKQTYTKRNEFVVTNRAGTPDPRIAVTRFTERTTQKTKYKITEL